MLRGLLVPITALTWLAGIGCTPRAGLQPVTESTGPRYFNRSFVGHRIDRLTCESDPDIPSNHVDFSNKVLIVRDPNVLAWVDFQGSGQFSFQSLVSWIFTELDPNFTSPDTYIRTWAETAGTTTSPLYAAWKEQMEHWLTVFLNAAGWPGTLLAVAVAVSR